VEPSRSLFELAGLLIELQDILGVHVDLVEASALRPEDDDILTDAIAEDLPQLKASIERYRREE
jgi:predicted nucleotidyltransferase